MSRSQLKSQRKRDNRNNFERMHGLALELWGSKSVVILTIDTDQMIDG